MNNHRRIPYKQFKYTLNLVVAGFLLGIIQVAGISAAPSGKEIMENRCAMCHDLPDPARLSDEQWILTLETMGDMAGLSSSEKGKVLDYVTAHERKAVTIISMAQERKLFETKCSLCHTTNRVLLMPLTPDSRQHIVKRMQKRAPNWISEDDVLAIMTYLNQGAPESEKPEHKPVSGGSAAVFRERCTACHTAERVYLTLQKSEEQGTAMVWSHIVNRMREKAPEWITEKEAQQILEYLGSIKMAE